MEISKDSREILQEDVQWKLHADEENVFWKICWGPLAAIVVFSSFCASRKTSIRVLVFP